MSQVKKLSVATVWGKISLADLIAQRRIHVMRVLGVAVSTKAGTSNYGDWRCLAGSFKATNPATGEISEAAVLFLPDVALVPIEVGLHMPGAHGVEFALDLFVEYVADKPGAKAGGSPYEYTFEPILTAAADSPIAIIEAKIAAQMLALAGPSPVSGNEGEKTAPAPAQAPTKRRR